MSLDTLDGMLAHELTDLLSAENQFSKVLAQTVKQANSDTVKQMAQTHLEETQQHIENLKQAFSILGEKPEKGMVCKGAQGIVEENTSTLKEEKPKGVMKDLTIIGGSLRVEHYEIAGYTKGVALARALGQKEVVKLLQANLAQEKATAKKLEGAATEFLNQAKSAA